MNILRHTSIYLLGIFATAAYAQEPLSKEITVEKEIIPQEREASRLAQQPQLVLPAIQLKKLSWTNQAVTAPVTSGITILPPSKYASSLERSPYRGYFDIGYFPTFQLGISAGYRLIEEESTKMGVWMQYDGNQYSDKEIFCIKPKYNDHALTLGMDLRHQFEDIGTLSATVGYGFNSLYYPVFESESLSGQTLDNGFNQTANRIGLGADWESKFDALELTAGLHYGFFGFSKPYSETDIKALNNNSFSINAEASYNLGEQSTIGADLRYSSTSFSEHINVNLNQSGQFIIDPAPSESYGVAELQPYFLLHGKQYSVRLGLELSAQTGDMSGVNIGPDIRLDWMPSGQFSLYAHLRGGNVTLNTLSAMMDCNHYINPSIAYKPTRMKGQIDLGFIIGPFAGASFEVWGGIGSYDNVNMPTIYSYGYDLYPSMLGMYAPIKFNSGHYGIAFNYNYRDIARLRISCEGAPQEYDSGYIEWQDRAKTVVNASLTLTPIESLDFTICYRMRADRSVYSIQAEEANIFEGYVYSRENLGKVNSLDISASYRVNDKFTIWANAENLLGQKWLLTYGVPNIGLTGLVGIGYKF